MNMRWAVTHPDFFYDVRSWSSQTYHPDHVAFWPVATDIVLQPNVALWGQTGSDGRAPEMTLMTRFGSGVCIAAVEDVCATSYSITPSAWYLIERNCFRPPLGTISANHRCG